MSTEANQNRIDDLFARAAALPAEERDAFLKSTCDGDANVWAEVQKLLAAHDRGLAGYWISAPLYAQDAVRATLELDAAWRPQACIALGHRSEEYAPFDRPAPDLETMLVER